MTSPWLDSAPPPDVRRLTDRELVATWKNNRNSVLGLMAADEGMRRLERIIGPQQCRNGRGEL